MPNMPDSYYDNFNASKNYEKILYRDGYTLQGAELNEAQSAAMHRLQGVADALFKDGDIIRDAGIIVDKETGEVRAQSGAVYLRGAVRGVPEATFTIPVAGTVAVGIRLTQRVVSELEDPALYNPAIGSRGEGEPGAWRLQVNAAWGFDGDNGDGEFYVVYTVDDGELRAKEAPPTLDTFTQSIAKYDRDSTAGGSYIVDGLTVLMAGDDADGHQVYTVSEGRARVNGYGVDMPTSRRLTYTAVPDLRRIDTEVHTADAASTQSGGQRITVAHPPLHDVEAVRITTRKTVSVVHGSYSGAADTLPDTSIVSSVFFMCLKDRILVFGDCAVNPNPTASQLADIAISSAHTARVFGVEPRVAMLSYSTGSSGKGEAVDEVIEATKLAHERAPELLLDGPIQYDAAIDPEVARTKAPTSPVAGHASVFIFPDLNTGNNTYKAVQRAANALAIGPVLQGLNKPVNDLSRGCTVPDIINTVMITAIQAQAEKGLITLK